MCVCVCVFLNHILYISNICFLIRLAIDFFFLLFLSALFPIHKVQIFVLHDRSYIIFYICFFMYVFLSNVFGFQNVKVQRCHNTSHWLPLHKLATAYFSLQKFSFPGDIESAARLHFDKFRDQENP